MDAIKLSLHHLKSGGAMGLAPEGTRSPSGQLQKGKTGAAYLADRSGVPILPAVVWGTEKVAQNLKRGRRTLVTCVIDKPFRLPSNGRAKGETLEQYTEIIMCRLAALLPPEYRGVYDNHPGLVGMPRPLSRRSGDL
jgi:1-acyl-sn-glycerol-3-phosphate acyltransferase